MTVFSQRICNAFSLIAHMMSPTNTFSYVLPTIVNEQPGTILQEDSSYRKSPVPEEANIPDYTFQDRDSQSHMNMFSSSNTSEGTGGNINNKNI